MKKIKALIDDWKFPILILCVSYLIILAFFKSCNADTNTDRNFPDTVYVEKVVKEIEIKEVRVPEKVFVYVKDTARRKQAEKKDIIIGMESKKKHLNIQRIKPNGLVVEDSYKLDLPAFQVDDQGRIFYDEQAAKRRAFWKIVGDFFKALGIAITFFLLGKII